MDRPREQQIYLGPLFLLQEKAAASRNEQGAMYCYKTVYFSSSFHGASFKGKENGKDIIRYLVVVSFSRLFFYYPLMTSAKFGVEREVIRLVDYKAFPIIPYASITKKQKREVARLADEIEAGHEPWDAIDELVADIYKLSHGEQDLVRDAYDYEMPFAESLKRAEARPDAKVVKEFCHRLKEVIGLSGKLKGQEVRVDPVEHRDMLSSWSFFRIGVGILSKVNSEFFKNMDWAAEPLDVSQIRHWPDGNENVIVGQLAQARYWTRSRAWRMGLDWRHNRLNAGQDQDKE